MFLTTFTSIPLNQLAILPSLEFEDIIDGGSGSDDIYGGHHKMFGKDSNDTLRGGDDDDVILGDNGEILREILGNVTDFPWTVFVWKTYPEPFNSEKIRDVRRYDDIDYVQGDDIIEGGNGNDILHGQRGELTTLILGLTTLNPFSP